MEFGKEVTILVRFEVCLLGVLISSKGLKLK